MVDVSNASRVVFPEVRRTKGDVVAYYERIAPRLLPHVLARPLSIKRYPKGLAGAGFFQKNAHPHFPASIARFDVPRQSKKDEKDTTTYPVVSEGEHLAYLANQGAIELHVPTATIADLMRPDRIVLDLDPPPNATDLVRKAAHLIREGLAAHGLETVPVATGSKGYHLVARVSGTSDDLWTVMYELSTLLAHAHPDVLSVAYRVVLRGKRVFIDWLRNAPLATIVAPYSIRARPKATVATTTRTCPRMKRS